MKYHKAAAVAASSHVRSCWLRPLRLVQERAAWLDHRSLPAPLALSSQLRQAMYTDQACSNTAAGACEKWGGGEDNRLSRLHIAYSKYLRREVILSLEIWKTGKRLESIGRFLVSNTATGKCSDDHTVVELRSGNPGFIIVFFLRRRADPLQSVRPWKKRVIVHIGYGQIQWSACGSELCPCHTNSEVNR